MRGDARVRGGDVDAPDAAVGYIRGGAGVEVDSRRLLRVVLGLCLLVLAALVIVLTLAAVGENSRSSSLRRHGVPVDVTVTGCLGLASGTGITASGYTCKGTFTLDGRSYTEVIGGITDPRPVGETLRAVADSNDPARLSLASAVAAARSPWKAFTVPAIPLLLLVGAAAVIGWRARRPRRRRRRVAGRASATGG
jgi:hypothetical protein